RPRLLTLFPYTTLFRSCLYDVELSTAVNVNCFVGRLHVRETTLRGTVCHVRSILRRPGGPNDHNGEHSRLGYRSIGAGRGRGQRSEEHTSELQSRVDLV